MFLETGVHRLDFMKVQNSHNKLVFSSQESLVASTAHTVIKTENFRKFGNKLGHMKNYCRELGEQKQI